MKKNNGKSKSLIIRVLKTRGLECNRVWHEGQRLWKVSDGKYYESLRDIWNAYKPKESDERN